MSENTQAQSRLKRRCKTSLQEEQVETKQEKAERTFTRAPSLGKQSQPRSPRSRASWEAEQAEAIERLKVKANASQSRPKTNARKKRKRNGSKRLKNASEPLQLKKCAVTQTLLSEEGLPGEFIDFVIDETAEATKEKIGTLRGYL